MIPTLRFPLTRSRLLAPLLILLMLALTLRAAAPAAPANQTKRLFWKIASTTTTVYFLGSIHATTPDMYPLPKEIEAAFKESAQLVVEVDIKKANPELLGAQAALQGTYPQGDSLDKHLSPETYKMVTDFFAANGLPPQFANSMKPPMAMLMVAQIMVAQSGLVAAEGIDLHFLNAAADAKDKKIIELETADLQMKLIFGLDDKLADRAIRDSFEEGSKEALNKVIKAWKEGDDKSMDTVLIDEGKDDPDAKKVNELMLFSRNDAMVKKIDDILKGKDKTFVVVGTAHMIGDRGILKQLETKGYKIERPTLTTPPARAASSPASAPR